MITPDNKKSLKTSLKKIRGLCDRLEKMVDEDAYCMEVLQQGNAGRGLFDGFNRVMVKNHLQTCGQKCLASKDEAKKEAFIEEFVKVIHRSN